jgi:hypothetical protein
VRRRRYHPGNVGWRHRETPNRQRQAAGYMTIISDAIGIGSLPIRGRRWTDEPPNTSTRSARCVRYRGQLASPDLFSRRGTSERLQR